MRITVVYLLLVGSPLFAGDGTDRELKVESPYEDILVPRVWRLTRLVDGDDKSPEVGEWVDVTSILGKKERQPGVIGETSVAKRAKLLSYDYSSDTAKLRVKVQDARRLRDATMHGRDFVIRPAAD